MIRAVFDASSCDDIDALDCLPVRRDGGPGPPYDAAGVGADAMRTMDGCCAWLSDEATALRQ